MAKLFSVASWNVEHFRNDNARVDRVVQFLRAQKPDVFALYEVEGAEVFEELVKRMPEWHFHITEGPQVQEILIGVKRTMTAFCTQRIEFNSGIQTLRPGALVTLYAGGQYYPMLFLHTKSGGDPLGLGIRDDMFDRALAFRKVLNRAAGGEANYLFLGDLNTMGMTYPFQKSIGAGVELQKLDRDAARLKMRRLAKTAPATWWNGSTGSYAPSDLDHVVAARHLKFKAFSGGAEISVRGWAAEPTPAAQDQWIKDHSDHCLLFFQVEK